ncbi:hypothetical protein Cgig2_021968 [Carnegiea gigantea]|uniref:superoxide dismutase n=1 Tax=Carnegiea gigantea TaxID=171969 RepID=A0A9Q1KR84_9CARY|nr:hypothetical protein Cgig2_021968 [Carnegiea gigantea]
MSAATAATALSLSSTFVSHEGFNGRLKYICVAPWKNKERQVRRAGIAVITAKFDLKPPPYPFNALEPDMSERTFEFHWGKHHRAYVDNLNKQVAGTELEEKPLEDVVRITYNKGDPLPAFNNAAQAWNHEFFWESMKPGGGGMPSGELLARIEKDFGSFDNFANEFKTAAATQFDKSETLDVGNAVNPKASDDDKKLAVIKTPNAVNPLVWNDYPLLTIDVWEHAYYLDYQNRRPDFISVFMEKLVNWDAVNARYEAAKTAAAQKQEELSKSVIIGTVEC